MRQSPFLLTAATTLLLAGAVPVVFAEPLSNGTQAKVKANSDNSSIKMKHDVNIGPGADNPKAGSTYRTNDTGSATNQSKKTNQTQNSVHGTASGAGNGGANRGSAGSTSTTGSSGPGATSFGSGTNLNGSSSSDTGGSVEAGSSAEGTSNSSANTAGE